MPGFFDGILIACTFPDPVEIAFSGMDGHLLTHYFGKTAPGKFTDAQQVAVDWFAGEDELRTADFHVDELEVWVELTPEPGPEEFPA